MMEMWLTRLILVLLTALGVSGQVPVVLDVTRRRVEVPLGSSVTFQCCLSEPACSRLWVSWYYNPSSFNNSNNLNKEIFNKSVKTSNSVVSNKTKQDSGHEGQDTDGAWRMYTLLNATENHSGWYFCKVTVDVPLLNITSSNGTEVVITKSKEHTTYPSLPIVTATVSPTVNFSLIDWWLWIILGVSTVVLIVLLVICVMLRRRRRRRSREEDPVYANTRPVNKQPSPRPGPDHLKAGSSSQNLRNQSPGGTCGEGQRRYK